MENAPADLSTTMTPGIRVLGHLAEACDAIIAVLQSEWHDHDPAARLFPESFQLALQLGH